MGLLGDLYSTIDSKKRQLRGLLSDPVETLYQGVRNFGAEQQGLLDMQARAYPWTGMDRNAVPDLAARKALADAGAAQGMAAATVWHGSPHKFDKFDSSKIGTGEGKQQQGIGSYLAEVQAVGQKYADKEAWKRGMDSGYLYKVDMPDSLIASMANHEAPLSSQPKTVIDAVSKMVTPEARKALKDYHGWDSVDDAPFAAVLDSLEIANGNNRAATSEALRKAGIPGIRYLDGGSRGAGQGSSNFVVFPGNEGLLSILERNGKPIK